MRYSLPRFVPLLALLLVLLPGCKEETVQQRPMATVSYIRIEPRRVTLTTELPGRTAPYTISDVRPQVTGIIQKRLFVEGSDVKESEVLYQIDPAEYQAAFNNAQANLQRAEANETAARLLAQRYATLVSQKAVSKQEHDDAAASYAQTRAEIAAAKAALESAGINLRYTQVKAPVSGRIGRSTVTEGALVTQNQANALAVIQQLDPMYVDVTQSSSELLRLRRAYEAGVLRSSGEASMQASLRLEDGTLYTRRVPRENGLSGFEHQPIVGNLKFSEVTVEASTGVVTIRALFPNPDGTLLPGMYVRAIIEEGVNEKALLIPRKSVVRNNRGLPVIQVLRPVEGQEGVFTPEARVLKLDRTFGNEWLVSEGLAEGELVLVEGLMHLRGNAPVKGERISVEEALRAKDVVGDRVGQATTAPNGKSAPAANGTAAPAPNGQSAPAPDEAPAPDNGPAPDETSAPESGPGTTPGIAPAADGDKPAAPNADSRAE